MAKEEFIKGLNEKILCSNWISFNIILNESIKRHTEAFSDKIILMTPEIDLFFINEVLIKPKRKIVKAIYK